MTIPLPTAMTVEEVLRDLDKAEATLKRMIKKPVLLVVEDSWTQSMWVQEMLKDGSGFHVLAADTLSKGLVITDKVPVSLVLLDLTLPDSEGIETISRMSGCIPRCPSWCCPGT